MGNYPHSNKKRPKTPRNKGDRRDLEYQKHRQEQEMRRLDKLQAISDLEKRRIQELGQRLEGPLSLAEGRELEQEMRDMELIARGIDPTDRSPMGERSRERVIRNLEKAEKETEARRIKQIETRTNQALETVDRVPDRSVHMVDSPKRTEYQDAIATRDEIKNEITRLGELAKEGDIRAEMAQEKWIAQANQFQNKISQLETQYIDEGKKAAQDVIDRAGVQLNRIAGINSSEFNSQSQPIKQAIDNANTKLRTLIDNPGIRDIKEIGKQQAIIEQQLADLDKLGNQKILDAKNLMNRADQELNHAAGITAPRFKMKLDPIKRYIAHAKTNLQPLVDDAKIETIDAILQHQKNIENQLLELDTLRKELDIRTPNFRLQSSPEFRGNYKVTPTGNLDRQKQKGTRRADGSTTGIIPEGKTPGEKRLNIAKSINAGRAPSQTPNDLPPLKPSLPTYIRGHQIADSLGGAPTKENINSHMFWQERKQTEIEEAIKKQMDGYPPLDRNDFTIKHVAYTEPNVKPNGLPVAREVRYKVYYTPPNPTDPNKREPQLIVDELIPDTYLQNNPPLTFTQAQNEIKKFRTAIDKQLDDYFAKSDDDKEPIYWEGKKLTPLGPTPVAYRDATGLQRKEYDTETRQHVLGPMLRNPTLTRTT